MEFRFSPLYRASVCVMWNHNDIVQLEGEEDSRLGTYESEGGWATLKGVRKVWGSEFR